jgi:hypothetical protein
MPTGGGGGGADQVDSTIIGSLEMKTERRWWVVWPIVALVT